MPTIKTKIGTILLVTTDNRFSLICPLGDGPIKITDGIGGWQLVPRPRKTAFTQFIGKNPFAMTIPILFDGYADGRSQEADLRTLTWMGLPPNDGGEPRKIRLYGSALPYPSSGEWVIAGITEGDMTIWNSAGNARLRQDISLSIIKYVNPDSLESLSTSPGLAPTIKGTYLVKAGDTFRSIAAFQYGDTKFEKYILLANNIRDTTVIHKFVGKTIIIPSVTGQGG